MPLHNGQLGLLKSLASYHQEVESPDNLWDDDYPEDEPLSEAEQFAADRLLMTRQQFEAELAASSLTLAQQAEARYAWGIC